MLGRGWDSGRNAERFKCFTGNGSNFASNNQKQQVSSDELSQFLSLPLLLSQVKATGSILILNHVMAQPMTILNALIGLSTADTTISQRSAPNNDKLVANQQVAAEESNGWQSLHYLRVRPPLFRDYDLNGNAGSNNIAMLLKDHDISLYNRTNNNNFSQKFKTILSKLIQNRHRLQQQQPTATTSANNNNDYHQRTNNIQMTGEQQIRKTHSAHLSCDSGEMVLRLNFTEPFRGIVYPDHNRLSPCRFFGDGHNNYELRLPLRGCGTRQVSNKYKIIIITFSPNLCRL